MMIYMDNAATTKMRREVVEAMLPFMTYDYGNPSANYEFACRQKNAIEKARADIAGTLSCEPEEIYFTSGGTEADNWAIKAAMETKRPAHMITSTIEHHAVLNSCKTMENRGRSVSYINVDSEGMIHTEQLEHAIRPDTALISIMAANNEIGTVQPLDTIGKIARRHHICFHTDAVQAYTNMELNMGQLSVDMLSVSAHKINGPKGVGFLYVRKGIELGAFMDGGSQEQGRRAGTENVCGIVGMAKAAKLSYEQMIRKIRVESELRDYMIDRILREIPYARLNGHNKKRLPGNVNVSFAHVDGGTLIAMLDQQNICAAAGSACTSASREPSHVLKAIGLSDELAHGTVRLTINEHTTRQEADYVVNCLKADVQKLQSMY